MRKKFNFKISKSNLISGIIGCIFTLLFVYIATNFTAILESTQCYIKNISDNYAGFLGFFGSFIGGLLGFLGALWGVNHQKNIAEKHEKYIFADTLAHIYGMLYLIEDDSTEIVDELIKKISIPFMYDEKYKNHLHYIKNPIDKLMIICLLAPFDKNCDVNPLPLSSIEPYLVRVLKDLGYNKSIDDIHSIYDKLEFIDNTFN